MDTVILSWRPQNLVTIGLMVAVIAVVLVGMAQAFRRLSEG